MNTSYAKLKIQLNFPLDSYAKIESFLECIKDIFPEQVVAYCGNSWKFVVKDGYSLKIYNSGTDFLNTYYILYYGVMIERFWKILRKKY